MKMKKTQLLWTMLNKKHTPSSNPSEIENRDFTGRAGWNPPLFVDGKIFELIDILGVCYIKYYINRYNRIIEKISSNKRSTALAGRCVINKHTQILACPSST